MPRFSGTITSVALLLAAGPSFAGHTHYFTWHQPPDDVAIGRCIAEMRQVVEARKGILAGPSGQGAAVRSDREIRFNGIGADAREPFVFPGSVGLNFCKTFARPYDEVVVACLLVARDYFPADVLELTSDGSWSDWSRGAELYTRVLHRPAHNPLGSSGTNGDGRAWVVLLIVAALTVLALVGLRGRQRTATR
ncbi:MAG: hypothetical protein JXB13_01580 [Phycisphaerae bacterium]|nr:hypothetical protein [Phycisphaerae bacterium]